MTDLDRARRLAAEGSDEDAKLLYLHVLHDDPTHCAALNELGTLALAGDYVSAARTAYAQAVRHHPNHAPSRVNLANILRTLGDLPAARQHYEAALDADAGCAEAHQGLAHVLTDCGDTAGAEPHWRFGFEGHAVVPRPFRCTGPAPAILLLVSAKGGNIPTRRLLDDRVFAVTGLFAEYCDPDQTLPPHALVFNAIGDADLCPEALAAAERVLARTRAPVINKPAAVRRTGRVDNAQRLGVLPDVVAPAIRQMRKASLGALDCPLLLRAPGFHTGQHFVRVERSEDLDAAAASLPGDMVLAIEYLDARGTDGMARKYRVMIVDGALYPLHLAISGDWKVHYFTAGMHDDPAHRAEEKRFLDDMPAVLGPRAMAALAAIARCLGLDYGGIDFALGPDGRVLLFEANATMIVAPPAPGPMWDYRRPSTDRVLDAVRAMLLRARPLRTNKN